MDFEPCFEVYNLVSIRPQSMKLGQMTNLNMIFHMVESVYRLVTIRNSPQFPVEFRNGLYTNLKQTSEQMPATTLVPAPYKQTAYSYDLNKKSETTNFVLKQNQ